MSVSNKYNIYGDIIGRGVFINGELNGKGTTYTPQMGWIKSPYFRKGKVFGLACIYNNHHEVIFYGTMYNNKKVKESYEYHPFLHKEYNLVVNHVVHDVIRKLSLDLT